MTVRTTSLAAVLIMAAGCTPLDDPARDQVSNDLAVVARAEDGRRVSGPDMSRLVERTHSAQPLVRAAAVRGIGRLENPDVTEYILPLLDDPSPVVRAEGANAVAQAHHRGSGSPAVRPLLARAEAETDPLVAGVVARSLGRLRTEDEVRHSVERALLRLSRAEDGSDAPEPQLLGVSLAIASMARSGQPIESAALLARTDELSRYRRIEGGGSERAGRVRAAAYSALVRGGRVDPGDIGDGLRDPTVEVRRVAASAVLRVREDVRPELVRRALLDPAPSVRLEAVRAIAAGPSDRVGCDRLLAVAERDGNPAVRIQAVDALARPCVDTTRQIAVLAALAELLRPGDRLEWHGPAHALVSLAAVAPERAQGLLPRFVEHANPFVRKYAATAAAWIGDTTTLQGLMRDPDDNVRAEALAGLSRLDGGLGRAFALTALADADDPQLVMNAARLLGAEGAPADGRAEVALATLERVSETRDMTRRDARMALLDLVEAAGDVSFLERLEPHLRDYDPAVASRAAAIMTRWSGDRYLAAPRTSPQLPFPTVDELRALDRTVVVLHMARGGEIRIRLHPWLAPTNASRLAALARAGSLDGLTFHRVAPNFVVQGLSPGANEYAGWGAYTRDEVGLTNQWRGTVGISTRGRDTGDGQIYFNLADNIRLDHDYTIIGTVVSGMEVVDAVREGDVVERVELREIP